MSCCKLQATKNGRALPGLASCRQLLHTETLYVRWKIQWSGLSSSTEKADLEILSPSALEQLCAQVLANDDGGDDDDHNTHVDHDEAEDKADWIDHEAAISKADIAREVSKVDDKDTSTLASLEAKGDQKLASEEDKPSRVCTFGGFDEVQLANGRPFN